MLPDASTAVATAVAVGGGTVAQASPFGCVHEVLLPPRYVE
jgi:hypothetical protein